jgi:putative transposase
MPQYARSGVPGGPFFFTLALLERRRGLRVERIADLWETFQAFCEKRPFAIDAIVGSPALV